MKRLLVIILLVFAGACASTEGGADPSAARLGESIGRHRVRHVLTGDTLQLENGDVYRLAGIEAPAPGEPFFEEARLRLDQFVVGPEVTVELKIVAGRRDGQGRRFASALVPARSLSASVLVNTELIEAGLAKIDYRSLPAGFERFFEIREARARETGAGIWSRRR